MAVPGKISIGWGPEDVGDLVRAEWGPEWRLWRLPAEGLQEWWRTGEHTLPQLQPSPLINMVFPATHAGFGLMAEFNLM